ncbi:flagellar basal-body rod protein FlgF [Candidatus Poribacteria bacterium]|nr:flagellar basal-body rod protein FlgF [Candidatus Poribacteria bacterium]
MMEGLNRLIEGMEREGRKFEIITNNLANTSTAGFKKDLVEFTKMLDIGPKEISKTPGDDNMVVLTDHTQGSINETNNNLDFAIEGTGLFVIDTPQGIRYSRDGNFCLNNENKLVTYDGYPVLDENNKPIIINKSKINVSSEGDIFVDDKKTTKFKLVTFENMSKLVKLGQNLFTCEGTKELKANVVLHQGAIESSNVNVMLEMSSMITIMRKYESYQKMIQFVNESIQSANREVGRST